MGPEAGQALGTARLSSVTSARRGCVGVLPHVCWWTPLDVSGLWPLHMAFRPGSTRGRIRLPVEESPVCRVQRGGRRPRPGGTFSRPQHHEHLGRHPLPSRAGSQSSRPASQTACWWVSVSPQPPGLAPQETPCPRPEPGCDWRPGRVGGWPGFHHAPAG